MAHGDPETVARASLDLLETRLRRLEFLLSGVSDLDGVPVENVHQASQQTKNGETIPSKLAQLQQDLHSLRKLPTRAGNLIRDVEALHSKVPELFVALTSTPSDLPIAASVVLSHAPLYPETASRLSSLQSLQIPPTEQSAKLINLQPRLNAALEKQQQLELEAIQLRERSARCLEWWVKVGVVGIGEVWEDWESRVTDVSRATRRIERAREVEYHG